MIDQEVLKTIISQWPTLGGLCLLGYALWTIFGKYIEESKTLLAEHKALSNHRAEEAERLRILMNKFEEHNRILQKEFANITIENKLLRKLVSDLEEMVRANGGDIKLISKIIEKNSEELRDISATLTALPAPKGDKMY